MVDKQKFKILSRITILVVLIFCALFFIKSVYSIFQTDAEGIVGNKVAFYIVKAESQTQQIKIGELIPNGQDYRYNITISNFNNEKTSEVDLEYTAEIKTTTNIPVTYELYANNGNTNIIGNRELIQDNNRMYFYKYTPQVGSFIHGQAKTDQFTLVINFPSNYNSSEYQNLIEIIEITVNANQV